MRILILGTTGVVGRQVTPRLVERGHHVRAVLRHPDRAAWLAQLGVEIFPGDILKEETLRLPAEGCHIALHLATAIPKPGEPLDWSLNDRIRREGTANLLKACQAGGVRRYVQQSITFVYGERGASLSDEDTPLRPDPVTASAIDMEDQVTRSGLDFCILRGGALYGLGSGREASWREAAVAGALQLPGDGTGYISLIHVVDLARAVVQSVESALSRVIFNVVDNEPVTYHSLFAYIAAQLSASPPLPGGPPYLPSLRCSNARIKRALGWEPIFPSFRSGLA